MDKDYLYDGIHNKIAIYSIMPCCGKNNTDKMVGELFETVSQDGLIIQLSRIMSASAIRDMGSKMIKIADDIDKWNVESEG